MGSRSLCYEIRKKVGGLLQDLLYNDSSITVTFFASNNSRPLVARDVSMEVPANAPAELNNDLLAVNTQDDMQQDIPSATIALTDDRNWSTLLVPNDYVEIKITYRSNIFAKEAGKDETFTLYTGLVSDVRRVDDASQNSRSYIVATQGLAKVLQNINLGTFTEISSESVPLFPDEEGQGIRVSGRSSANIIAQILNRFVWNDLTDYKFGLGGKQKYKLKDILRTKDNDGGTTIIGNVEEAQPVPEGGVSFIGNYNGSILQMIKDTSSRPFNELFWTHEEGKATLHYRPTPFDQDIWKSLPYITIEPNAIIKEEIDVTDQDQSSVFKLTPSEKTGTDTSNWIDGMVPITDAGTKLISRYGYKIMNVSTDYFAGVDNEDTDSKVVGEVKDTTPSQTVMNEEQAKKHYPPYAAISDVFSKASGDIPSGKEKNWHTLPDGTEGERIFNDVKTHLQSDKRKDFIEKIATISVNSKTGKQLISKKQAGTLWDRYNKSQNRLGRVAYMQIVYPNYYIPTTPNITNDQKLTHLYSFKAMKKHPKKAANQLIQALNRTIGSKQAYEIIQYAIKNNKAPDDATYSAILQQYKYEDSEDGVSDTGRKGSANNVPAMIEKYTEKLFNWYADNGKFYSGTITITGTKGVELGKRLFIHDTHDNAYWEFYIESVGHQYSFTNGWTTSIGVTRGMPVEQINSDRRFQQPYSFYGNFQRFNGGYFGEQNLGALQEKARAHQDSGGDDSDSGDDDSGDGKVKVSKKTDPQWGCYTYLRTIANDAMKHGKKISGMQMYITSGYRPSDTYGHGYRQAIDIAFDSGHNGSPYYKKVGEYVYKKYSKYVAYVICNNKVKDRSGLSGTGSSGKWVNWAQGGHLDHMHINGIYGNWGQRSKRIK